MSWEDGLEPVVTTAEPTAPAYMPAINALMPKLEPEVLEISNSWWLDSPEYSEIPKEQKLLSAIKSIKEMREQDQERGSNWFINRLPYAMKRMPIPMNPAELTEVALARKAHKRYLSGNATAEDYSRIARYTLDDEEFQNQTWLKKGFDTSGLMLPFLADILAAGGFGAGKQGIQQGAKLAVEETLKQAIAKAIGRAVASSVKMSANPVFAPRILASTERRNLQSQMASEQPTSPAEFGKNLVKSYVDNVIELNVEQMGAVADVALEPLRAKAKDAVTKAIGTIWAKKTGQTAKKFSQLRSKIGLNGIVGELAEEQIVPIIQGMTTEFGDFGTPGDIVAGIQGDEERFAKGLDDLKSQVVAIAGMQLGFGAGARIGEKAGFNLADEIIKNAPKIAEQIQTQSRTEAAKTLKENGYEVSREKVGKVKKDIADRLAEMTPKQREKFTKPENEEALRDELNQLSGKEIAEKFGYKKGRRKQWMIDDIVQGRRQEQQQQTQSPVQQQPEIKQPESTPEVQPEPPEQAPINYPKGAQDADVQRGWERLNDWAPSLKPSKPKTQEHLDAVQFANERGLRVEFFEDTTGESTIEGMTENKTIFIPTTETKNAFWNIVGHEVAHATSIDVLSKDFDEDVINAAAQDYYETSSPRLKKLLDKDPTKMKREGVAMTIGRFMQDPKFRQQLQEQNKPLFKRIIDAILNAVKGFKAKDPNVQKAIELLKDSKVKFAEEAKQKQSKLAEERDARKASVQQQRFKANLYEKTSGELASEYGFKKGISKNVMIDRIIAGESPAQQQGKSSQTETQQEPIQDSDSFDVDKLDEELEKDAAAKEQRSVGAAAAPQAASQPPSPQFGKVPPLSEVIKSAKRGRNAVATFLKKNWLSAGLLPKAIHNMSQSQQGNMKTHMFDLDRRVNDLSKALRERYGLTWRGKLSEAQLSTLNDGVAGLLDHPDIAQDFGTDVADAIIKMREHLDSLSRQLIRSGAAEGELAAKIQKNLGLYLHRSYRKHDVPNWIDKVPEDIKNWGTNFVRSAYPNLSDLEIETKVADLLYSDDAPMKLLSQGKLGAKNLSIFKERKDWPAELRALWGEYEDPFTNYSKSVMKMAAIISNHKFLTDVKTHTTGVFFFDKDDSSRPPTHVAKISAEGNPSLEPLDGMYTTPEIKEAFDTFYEPNNYGAFLKNYMKMLGLSRYSKTVLSWMSTMRNFLGNPAFLVAHGHVNPKYLTQGIQTWPGMRRLLGMNAQQLDRQWRRYLQLGIVDTDVRAQDAIQLIEIARQTDVIGFQASTARAALRKSFKAANATYQSMDNFWKIVAFESEYARQKAADPSFTEEQAARIIRNTMPTYDLIPAAIKWIRKSPLIGPFVSFPSEVIRTSYHSLLLTAQELSSSNPKVRKIGATRLVGMGTVAAAVPALIEFLQYATGIDDEDLMDLLHFLPPWQQNNQVAPFSQDDKGNISYIDVSYMDPHSVLREPIIALMRGKDWQDKLKRAALALGEPYYSQEILTKELGRLFVDSYDGKKDIGAEDWIKGISKALEPGTITSLRRITYGAQGRVIKRRKYDFDIELPAALTGVRLEKTNITQSMYFNSIRARRGTIDQSTKINAILTNKGNINLDDIATQYKKSERVRREHFNELHEAAKAALRLGVPEEEVLSQIQSAGYAKTKRHRWTMTAQDVIDGIYTPYRPSSQTEKAIKTTPNGDARFKKITSLYQQAHGTSQTQQEGS